MKHIDGYFHGTAGCHADSGNQPLFYARREKESGLIFCGRLGHTCRYVGGRNRSSQPNRLNGGRGAKRMEMFVHVGVRKRSTSEIEARAVETAAFRNTAGARAARRTSRLARREPDCVMYSN